MSTLFSYFKPVQEKGKKKNEGSANNSPLHEKCGNIDSGNGEETRKPQLADTPKTMSRKRSSQVIIEESEGEEEIGLIKNKAGHSKRVASMSVKERSKLKNKKRKRMFDSDNESDDDYKVPPTYDSSEDDVMETEEENTKIIKTTPNSKTSDRYHYTPRSGCGTPSVAKTPSSNMATPRLSLSSPPLTPSTSNQSGGVAGPTLYLHQKLDWLKEANIKDKSGHRPNHPDYNPRTLMVPMQFLNKSTPALKQWWKIKSENFDTVLFFKVGKFYELYHMDAEIGVKELGLTFMKGDFAHSGFPEVAFGRYSQTLVQRGYKVGRVEQTETPQMLDQRKKNSSGCTPKSDKVVKRELCSLITKGTRTIGFFEDAEPDSEAAFLLAIKEKPRSNGDHEFGVCFVDTCIGTFHLGQFIDDRQCSRLRTLMAHYPPSQVVTQRRNISFKPSQVLHQVLSNPIHDTLNPGSEFWDGRKTLKVIKDENLFRLEDSEDGPLVLTSMLAEDDSLGLTPRECYELGISCLGACVWTLKRAQIEKQLLSMKQFKEYVPIDREGTSSNGACLSHDVTICNPQLKRLRMVLDDITLHNLDVIDSTGVSMGTLLHHIDHCTTSFGKRLLKQWLCSPLCDPEMISLRLDAVNDLITNHALLEEVKELLKTLPDMERLLRRVVVMGYKHKDDDAPECRAILYEETTYSKKKIVDFLNLLNGFKESLALPDIFTEYSSNTSSKLLHRLLTISDESGGGKFPNMVDKIEFFEKAFDHARARKEGTIIPQAGVNEDYDEAERGVNMVKQQLEEYLQKQRKRMGSKSISYWGSNVRSRYQLEVPENVINSRGAPDDYQLKSQRKGYRRYWTRDIEELLDSLQEYEEQRDSSLKDTMRAVFHKFSNDFQMWESAIECLAIMDVLVSMAMYSGGSDMCRPEVCDSSVVPFLDIRGGRHPCVTRTYSGDDFIPNDVSINSEQVPNGRSCVVVTGPNMGGKSTLMRQTGLIVILAQMGSYVPAESCTLSPCDRIFTRLGASDRITRGESTFFVELSETSVILQHATPHSLVLLDELGRGTATYDGTVIAGAVVSKIARHIGCRTMFSTHYHSLVDELSHDPHVTLGHMSCMVENDDSEVGVAEEESITFLYKFIEGACPKSYGFNAARLAGLPREVIRSARNKSCEFELNNTKQKIFRKLMKCDLQLRDQLIQILAKT